MRNLTLNKLRLFAGTAYAHDEPPTEKVKAVLNDGLESVGILLIGYQTRSTIK